MANPPPSPAPAPHTTHTTHTHTQRKEKKDTATRSPIRDVAPEAHPPHTHTPQGEKRTAPPLKKKGTQVSRRANNLDKRKRRLHKGAGEGCREVGKKKARLQTPPQPTRRAQRHAHSLRLLPPSCPVLFWHKLGKSLLNSTAVCTLPLSPLPPSMLPHPAFNPEINLFSPIPPPPPVAFGLHEEIQHRFKSSSSPLLSLGL